LAPFTVSGTENLSVPTLHVAVVSHQLGEVTVATQKPLFEQQLDKLVINVQSTLTAAGSTALDVLERSPGVVVNRQNNALSLSGKSGVVVMINGKISRLPMDAVVQMLGGMQAGNIEKVELITNPSARYDAEGDAGIINIVLKKNTDYGTNGSYSLTAGHGRYERPAASVNFNHRASKWNVFGDYSFGHSREWSELTTNGTLTFEEQFTHNYTLRESTQSHRSYNARLGVDYQFSPQTLIGVLLSGFANQQRTNVGSLTHIEQEGELQTQLDMTDRETNQWRHGMVNLNLRHQFAGKGELSLDVDYLRYSNSNPHHYQNSYQYLDEDREESDLVRIEKETPIEVWVFKGDYQVNLSKQSKLELGAKATHMGLDNRVAVSRNREGSWEPEAALSQSYTLQDDISAVYTNLNHSFTPKTKLQAGLRYEYTSTDIGPPNEPVTVRRRYGNLFPSVFLSHELSKKNSVQLSYSRRIGRPDYTLLAPWVIFTSPFSFVTGNPNLLPTLTDAFQAAYRFRENHLVSLKYSHDRNALDRFRVVQDPETNLTFVTPQNVRSLNTLSLTFSFPLQVAKWWQLQTNLLGVYQRAASDIEGRTFALEQQYANVFASNRFTMPGGFTGELKAYYQTPFLWGSNRMRSTGSVDLALQKKLPNDKGSLTLGVTDLFWTQGFRVRSLTPAADQTVNWQLLREPRVVRLTYSKSFGNQQVKAARRRATGSEEERSRVGN
jgi:outer membrane receptor protein involved in Fe transport